jgi:hypothetical protein
MAENDEIPPHIIKIQFSPTNDPNRHRVSTIHKKAEKRKYNKK